MKFTEKKIKEFREKFYEGFNPNTHDQCYVLGQDECIELEAFIRKTISEAAEVAKREIIGKACISARINELEILKNKILLEDCSYTKNLIDDRIKELEGE